MTEWMNLNNVNSEQGTKERNLKLSDVLLSTKQMRNEDVIIKQLWLCLPGKAAAPLDVDGSLLLYI